MEAGGAGEKGVKAHHVMLRRATELLGQVAGQIDLGAVGLQGRPEPGAEGIEVGCLHGGGPSAAFSTQNSGPNEKLTTQNFGGSW